MSARQPLLYVLSAGRTGTVFLERLIHRHCPHVTAEHEPAPSRYLLMLGNLRNDTGLLPGFTRRFARWHQDRRHGEDGTYIEINPFLCPVTDLLARPDRPVRVVHMVRAPGEWAQSMTTFKASARYRHVIDYVPFAKPYPSPRPKGWRQLRPFEKALHRWNWCNTCIAGLAEEAERYALVRSEDVFTANDTVRNAALERVFAALELDMPPDLDPALFQERVNPAPAGEDLRDVAAVREICGEHARRYGYDV